MERIKPVRLRRGDVVGIVAPASRTTTEEKVHRGIQYLERLGYRVKAGRHIFDVHGYCAGRDEDRAADFNAMIYDREVKAIFTIRGGYGTPRLLHLIDYTAIKKYPKIIVGYSDISALLCAIYRKTGLINNSGPMIGVEMWNEIDPFTEEHFWRLITSPKKIGKLKQPADQPLVTYKEGKAEGRLIASNLSLLTSITGTTYLPSFNQSVLLIEDVDEEPHRIDRMLAQLYQAGLLKKIKALCFGSFVSCNVDDESEPHFTLEQVLQQYAQKVNGPVMSNILYGHVEKKFTFPIGVTAVLNTRKNYIEITESAVI